MTLRRRRRQVGASTRNAPIRANGSRKLPSRSATRSGKPSTRPQDCHSATMSSLLLEENSGSDSAGIAVLEHDGDRGRRRVRRSGQADGNAAEGGDRQIQRHAHAADAATHHDALAMQIDDAPALVGRFIGGFETHGQRERVEPQCAARPGSDPAGFHLTPRKLGSHRAVAARLPRQCQSAVAIGLKTLVKRSYRTHRTRRMIDEPLPRRGAIRRACPSALRRCQLG